MQVEIILTRPVDLKPLGVINGNNYINWKTKLDEVLVKRDELSTSNIYAVECEHLYYSDRARTKVRTKRMRYLFKINRMDGDGYRYVVKSQFPDILQFPITKNNHR